MALNLIHQRPSEFLAALEFTSAQTGFSARLIEKDYWCSLILKALFDVPSPLVFKGGTLLSKAYANFDRLSEDLDFTIPTEPKTTRAEKSRRAHELESLLNDIRQTLDLEWSEAWRGHNSSTQHTGKLAYSSILGGTGAILVEVSQRDVLERPTAAVELKTLLLDPIFSEPILAPVKVKGLSKEEAYAEKARAALTRKEPAIRDIYDLWQAAEQKIIHLDSPDWIAIAKRKCEGHDLAECCSVKRRAIFEKGVQSDLVPVLRNDMAEIFDFNTAWEVYSLIHSRIV